MSKPQPTVRRKGWVRAAATLDRANPGARAAFAPAGPAAALVECLFQEQSSTKEIKNGTARGRSDHPQT